MEEKLVFCKGGGCTAKLGAGVLERVLSRLPKGPSDPNLLVGYDSKDDAAVYRVSDDVAIVQTLDFSRPWWTIPAPSAASPPPTPSATSLPWAAR